MWWNCLLLTVYVFTFMYACIDCLLSHLILNVSASVFQLKQRYGATLNAFLSVSTLWSMGPWANGLFVGCSGGPCAHGLMVCFSEFDQRAEGDFEGGPGNAFPNR